MADDQNLCEQQHYSQYNYAPIPVRIIHEYDFFADKYIKTHKLPLPQNPEALREFFVPELMPPPRVFRGQQKTAKVHHEEIPHPKLIAATSIRIFGVDFNVDQETAIRSINKGKEKMVHMGESSSNIQGDDDDEDKNTRLMGKAKGIIINEDKNTRAAATNLGNPNVDHQEIRDIPKLIDIKAATSIRIFGVDINAGFNLSPSSSHSTKGIIIREENIEKKKKTRKRKSENSCLDDHKEKAPPLFHPSILTEIQHGHDQPVLLFEKVITISDTNGGQNRLLISDAHKLLKFLREEEIRKVEDKEDYLEVIAKEAFLARNQHTLHLTKWKMGKDTIVLKHDWHKFVVDNELQCGNLVQGWGYRGGDEFRLALNIIEPVNSQVS